MKDKKVKHVTYKSEIIDKSLIVINLWTDEFNNIYKCYIDFKTLKNNNKVNGTYALKISNVDNFEKLSIRFVSRTGWRYTDFSEEIAKKDTELYINFFKGNITIALIDELIDKIIPIINNQAQMNNKPLISPLHRVVITKFLEQYKQSINFINEIKKDIPLPHLQCNLNKFNKGKRLEIK